MADPVSAIFDLGGKLIDRLWPDPAHRAAAQLELIKLQQDGELQQIAGQLEINKVEAANPKVFVSGWRPCIGWVCAGALAWQFIVAPLLTWLASLFGRPIVVPELGNSDLFALLTTMLGASAQRTFEKIKGVASR